MNNQNKTFIALHGGKECRRVAPFINPFDYGTEVDEETTKEYSKFLDDFEANNPIIPLTEVMPEGETFSGSEVFRYASKKNSFNGKWVYCTESDKEQMKKDGNEIEFAIAPLKAIESVNPSRENLLNEIYNPDMQPLLDVVENKETVEQGFEKWQANLKTGYGRREIFEAGADWQQSQSIEGIVGFAERMRNDFPSGEINAVDITNLYFAKCKELSDIIKELNK